MAEADSPPRPAVAEYVNRLFPGAVVTPLAGDASSRRFHRIVDANGASRVVMDYGRPFDGETDDLRLGRIFRAAGLRVAEVEEIAPEIGCLVLEDLGDRLLERALVEGSTEDRLRLLRRAVELAADVRRRGTPVLAASDRARGPALDAERFRFEMEFFLEHYACGLRGRGRVGESLRAELHEIARLAALTPERVLCHRDFHSRNLLLLEDGALAMVDIQDARWGPDGYDLASLLRDAYIDIPEEWVEPLVRHYLRRLDAAPAYDEFERRFDVVAAQRMLKALGTFGYQVTTLGRQRYAGAIPRTLGRLRRLLPLREETRALHENLDSAGLLDDPGS